MMYLRVTKTLLAGLLLAALEPASCRYTSRVRVPDPDKPMTRDWPCPSAVDIDPCVCESDEYYNLAIDCSNAIDEMELFRVFEAAFPFEDILELTIIQDPLDPNRNIRMLQEKVFGPITFERIRITGTKMAEVHEEAFVKSHDFLTYLNLADNQLRSFPFETLVSYSKLDTLLFDNNNFTNLYSIESTSLHTLSVSGNHRLLFDLDVFTKAPALTAIYMANIDLDELPPNLFSTLENIKTISLEDNYLKALPEFAFNPVKNTMTQLILNGNLLNNIYHDSIHGMAGHGFLSMVRNKMEYLESTIWQPIFEQAINGSVNLAGNPLVCGCDIAWLMLANEDRYLRVLTETTTCNEGTVVHSLDKQYFVEHCPTVLH
ncbi:oplophorus-luciferin 2-monooxygenase non-catalytic subunit-like [Penaeus chinensis]|uniref:oplophorus-luciferin 2-monooxygenase non-catalytic subunit-like n=1 Tax=Penaeus chinensis TaxID=139456 RepID=UPI001FB5DE88|nr:oplophorus-luciferin 2-monooxygenase non-catalytic subunit-like [Penaeus chinensis]